MEPSVRINITATPPFDFNLSATIFEGGDPEIRAYQDGRFRQVIRLGERLILATVTPIGTVDEPRLAIDLESDHPISTSEKRATANVVRRLFNLDFDLAPFYRDVRRDPVMAKVTRRLRGLKSPQTQTVFEALVDSIIEQQISLRAAHGMERRVVKMCGGRLNVRDRTYYAFPAPEALAAATLRQLRACGLSTRKTEYIRDISKAIVDGRLDLEGFRHYADTKPIIEELCRIRGIGRWTAELTMLRGMAALDAMPADDLGLRRVIAHYYADDRRIEADEARTIAERWGRWKGLAGYYLIVATILDVEV
jgi:DNA-3-methyladenine glycosylase II